MNEVQNTIARIFPQGPSHFSLGPVFEMQIPAIALQNREMFMYFRRVLKAEHFEFQQNAVAWMFITSYFKKFQQIPSASVINHWFSQSQFNYEVPAVDEQSADYIKERVIQVVRAQRFQEFMQFLFLEQAGGVPDYDELLKKLKDVTYLKPESSQGVDYFSLQERFEKVKRFWMDRIPSGFPSLDSLLPGGGFGKKELYAWMGKPGVGKTIWLVVLGAQFIKAGFRVLHITREVSEEIVALRYDSHFLQSTTDSIIEQSDVSIQRLETLRRNLFDSHGIQESEKMLMIKEYPTGAATVGESRVYCEDLRDRYGFEPDIIIDDYLDLARPEVPGKDEYENQARSFVDFRGWMVDAKKSGITATQTHRMLDDTRTVRMENTADSFAKPRTLDGMFTINESTQDRIHGVQRLFFAKSRNSRSNMFAVFQVIKETMSIQDMNQIYDESSLVNTGGPPAMPGMEMVNENDANSQMPF